MKNASISKDRKMGQKISPRIEGREKKSDARNEILQIRERRVASTVVEEAICKGNWVAPTFGCLSQPLLFFFFYKGLT